MSTSIATYFEAVFFFIFGSILGSFFNVLIYRLPAGESVVFPASHCPKCKKRLEPFENIPILSWILLRGKCSGCSCSISIQYPLIEFSTALLSLLLWFLIFNPFFVPQKAYYIYLPEFLQIITILILIPISIIDIRHYIIPDSITLGGLVLAIIFSFIPEGISPVQSLIGILAGGGSLYAIGLIGNIVLKKEETMGGGDIKLMGFIGALWGWNIAATAIILGAFAGTIVGLILLLLRKLDDDHKIPFGPFLAIGIVLSVFTGDILVKWYLNFINY